MAGVILNLHIRCTLTTLHCSKVSFLTVFPRKYAINYWPKCEGILALCEIPYIVKDVTSVPLVRWKTLEHKTLIMHIDAQLTPVHTSVRCIKNRTRTLKCLLHRRKHSAKIFTFTSSSAYFYDNTASRPIRGGKMTVFTCDNDTIRALTPHCSLIIAPSSCPPLVSVALASCSRSREADDAH